MSGQSRRIRAVTDGPWMFYPDENNIKTGNRHGTLSAEQRRTKCGWWSGENTAGSIGRRSIADLVFFCKKKLSRGRGHRENGYTKCFPPLASLRENLGFVTIEVMDSECKAVPPSPDLQRSFHADGRVPGRQRRCVFDHAARHDHKRGGSQARPSRFASANRSAVREAVFYKGPQCRRARNPPRNLVIGAWLSFSRYGTDS